MNNHLGVVELKSSLKSNLKSDPSYEVHNL